MPGFSLPSDFLHMASLVVVFGLGIGAAAGAVVFGAAGAAIGLSVTLWQNKQRIAAAERRTVTVYGLPCIVDAGFVVQDGGLLVSKTNTLLLISPTNDWATALKLPVTFIDTLRFETRMPWGMCTSDGASHMWVCDGRASSVSMARATQGAARSLRVSISVGFTAGVLSGAVIGGWYGIAQAVKMFRG